MSALYETVKDFFEFVANQVKYMGWVDVVDILILAVCIYYVYRFISDRRAMKLAVGIVLIVALHILSDVFEMHALRFILQNFFQVGIILLIIVFQPELRSALEKVGGKPLEGLNGLGSDAGDREFISASIDTICDAACDLAREKTGALIVIERSTKLGDFIRSGDVINAQLTSSLIKNVFFNKAPLHDGAMIIRGMRIYAAGCFLPLSTREDIDKNLGTRHRAAIGLSEVSDAIVIVVSEETGVVSVALDGEIKRNYNYSTLKAELSRLLLQTSSSKVKIKAGKKSRSENSAADAKEKE